MTVKQIAAEYYLWQQIETAVEAMLTAGSTADFLEEIGQIPVRRSSATRRLGAYVSIGRKPVCIRLQFAQESDSLKQTFLHEVAHACDHLSHNKKPLAHGSSWKVWARALGISTQCCGESEAVRLLHQQRVKLIAVCQKCGAEFHRVRRLNRNRVYIHQNCGGKIKSL